MQSLQDAIEKKRKEKEQVKEVLGKAIDSSAAAKKPKYLTNAQKQAIAKGKGDPTLAPTIRASVPLAAAAVKDEPQDAKKIDQQEEQTEVDVGFSIPKEEVFHRLRLRRQPVTLFGETDQQRMRRLRHIELMAAASSTAEDGGGQRNFLIEQEKAHKDEGEDKDTKKKEEKVWNEDEVTEKEDVIRYWLKRLVGEWSKEINSKMAELKTSAYGRQEINRLREVTEYLKPLFRELKKKTIKPDLMESLFKVVKHCKAREYNKALDAYILIAIGNAPWPMGVTQVGIHERSAREKLHASGVAHILNDETTRKYIQCVKRVITYAQRIYPPDDLALAVA